ncbi:pirin family protein [Streptomyces telluris]|uniref:Pirin family protein n=1 Tax=Streptomyces telluris TaxID=2720021 RepID=A0A9X2LFD6_9ACTN|nr:pirin family protein [Streptomyces telluris]MCQ8770036.1 pirin family protein [Streptomyces telluris]NJP79157.1 pirin family protein [Streptomyces telluris]
MTHVQRSVQRAGERFRGGDPEAGIETWHAFSFSGFYDPDNVRFGPLAACNEERLAAGAGFAEHPHRDVEIVTWVVEGELTHEDSTGHTEIVRPGDVQRLSAGAGVHHTERNEGGAPLRFVQMWLTPSEYGGEPSYEVVRGVADDASYVLPGAEAVLHVRRLRAGERGSLPGAPWVYVHVVRGDVRVDGDVLRPGDAARLLDASAVEVEALGADAELLAWEMHAEPHFG